MMVAGIKNGFKGEIGIGNSFNKDLSINSEDELFMEIHLGKLS